MSASRIGRALLVLTALLVDGPLHAATARFCGGVAPEPGGPVAIGPIGTLEGLATGYYRVEVSVATNNSFPLLNGWWDPAGPDITTSGGVLSRVEGATPLGVVAMAGSNAQPGSAATVTWSVYSLFNQHIGSWSHPVYVGGSDSGWDTEWSDGTSHALSGYSDIHVGDFDGDGDDELLRVGSGDWITLFEWNGSTWAWAWSNYGDTGEAIHPYRHGLVAGDFDGDGDDELIGAGTGTWTTMFEWNGGGWDWTWSTYGETSNPIHPFRHNLISGDFDGDGADELVGLGLIAAVLDFEGGDWVPSWVGTSSDGDGVFANHSSMRYHVGDFDGDGDEELLRAGSQWLTSFQYDGTDWHWDWSNNGSVTAGDGIYADRGNAPLIVGDFDGDGATEVLQDSARGGLYDFEGGDWSLSWQGSPAGFVGAWSLRDLGGGDAEYRAIRLADASGELLLASRAYCDGDVFGMLELQ